jgi:hypothetical protein
LWEFLTRFAIVNANLVVIQGRCFTNLGKACKIVAIGKDVQAIFSDLSAPDPEGRRGSPPWHLAAFPVGGARR